MNKRTYRMYGFVPYNISAIQKGIQFGHAVVEYMRNEYRFGDLSLPCTQWADDDKTFIILNGGTTNTGELVSEPGSMNGILDFCKMNNIPHAAFYEPDLGDQLTAVVFLADERSYDFETYPSPRKRSFNSDMEFEAAVEKLKEEIGIEAFQIRELIKNKPLAL